MQDRLPTICSAAGNPLSKECPIAKAAGELSDKLNNLLTGVMLSAGILQEKCSDEEQRNRLLLIIESSRLAAAYSADLRALSDSVLVHS